MNYVFKHIRIYHIADCYLILTIVS